MTINKRDLKIILIVIILAAALRVYFLDDKFYGDEIALVGPARHYLIDGDLVNYNSCGTAIYNFAHPPVKLITYVLWAQMFGFSEISMRMIPFLFGLLTVAFTYIFGKKLFGERAGIAAAVLMAVGRYHIHASHVIATDSGILIFSALMSLFCFYMYKEKSRKIYLAASFAFFFVAIMTKFSAVTLIFPMYILSFLYYRKSFREDFIYITGFLLASFAVLFAVANIAGAPQYFYGPVNFALKTAGNPYTLGEFMHDKAFKIATMTWQATPFLAVLVLLALLHLKRDKNTVFVTSWLLVTFFVVFVPYGTDTQRNFFIALPAVFLLAGKYISDIKIDFRKLALAAIIPTVYYLAAGVTDFSGYYNPIIMVPLFALPFAYLLLKPNDRKIFLVGGMLAMTLFIFIGNNYTSTVNSNLVGELADKTLEMGINYTDVATTKDIAVYLTPSDKVVYVCEVDPARYKESNLPNIVLFYPSGESFLESLNCSEDSYYAHMYGHLIGIVCERT